MGSSRKPRSAHCTSSPPSELVRETILRLCGERGASKSVCPSEVARALDAAHWRGLMPAVRAVSAELAAEGRLQVTQRGVAADPEIAKGAIRLRIAATI